MAITIRFDSVNKPEMPTLILARKSGEKIGTISTASQIRFKDNLNSYAEFSFVVHKKRNGKKFVYWNSIRDFRLLYVPEWEKWFEIHVKIQESDNCIKSITAVSLSEAELSNVRIYDTEVNTEDDIARSDYIPTVLFDEKNVKASLLHRVLSDKVPNYKILHVDSSIQKIQRNFSFDDISIYDALQEIAQEIHCLFIFGLIDESDNNFRTISVYDLDSFCNDCGNRGEFTTVCPECGSSHVMEGYGKDTTIFISSENLADEISYSTDTDSVKNCFRLEAGDDDMTAAIINSNPAGSQYSWYITDYMKEDMSEGLVTRLDSYDADYSYYQNGYEAELDPVIVKKYNQLIQKYKIYNKDLESIATPVKGYRALMKIYYDTVDFSGYLKNTLMPTVAMTETTAKEQVSFLTAQNLSPVSVENVSYISLATANSAVLNYAKVYIDTAKYKIKVKSSSITGTEWTGNFTATSYYDEEDTADSKTITIQFNNNYENFLRQKIEKTLSKDEKDDLSIVGLFKKTDDEFKADLKKYCLSYLQIFNDSCQSCLNLLIEQGVADKDAWNSSSAPSSDLYKALYEPYLNKSSYIAKEIQLRESEINTILGAFDTNGDLITNGMQSSIIDRCNSISEKLNFQKYIGEYWNEFCTFRREDSWKNENYISTGLSNAELFKRAEDFIQAAKKDLIKSSTLQHTISSTLKNLLVIKEFSPIKEYFSVGNWLRIMIDETIYKLRLISYEIDFDNLEELPVEFSDVIQGLGVVSDIQSILKQSQSMSSSYSSVKQQAVKGEESNTTIKDWVEKGLDATVTQIVNSADNQDVVYDRHGLLFRKKDDISDTFSPIQIKIINSTFALTTDNWKTSKVGVGRFIYFDPKDKVYKTGYGVIANQIVGNIILSEEVGIYNEAGSMTFDTNGLVVKNDKNTVTIDPNSETLFVISNQSQNVFEVDENGNLNIIGKLTVSSGSKIGHWTVTDTAIYNTNSNFGASNGKYFGDQGLSITDKFKVDKSGNITASGTLSLAGGKLSYSNGVLSVSGKVSASSGSTFGHWTISDTAIYHGDSSFGSKSGKYFGAEGISITDKFKVDKLGNIIASGSLTLAGGKLSYSDGTLYIEGVMEIAGGHIGGWKITETDIYDDNNDTSAGIGKVGTTFAFWAGTNYANRNKAPFRVGHEGYLYAEQGKFGGSLSAVNGTFTDLKAGNSEFHPTWILIDADGQSSVRIGTPDYNDWVDITIKPIQDNKGNIGTPDNRWSTIYSRVIAEGSERNTKENIIPYDNEHAYEELKNMPLYTYFYKGVSSETKTMSIGTMIDYIPNEVMLTTPNDNDSFNLSNLLFWCIGACQVMQKKIEDLETIIEETS